MLKLNGEALVHLLTQAALSLQSDPQLVNEAYHTVMNKLEFFEDDHDPEDVKRYEAALNFIMALHQQPAQNGAGEGDS